MDATDVQDQLAIALGGAYRVERELGGGGMSRVFLAHDVTLGRDVVVKILPPALAKGLSAERFAREIRLAAALQEPHIVPVLAAGTTPQGLPYYTMPFVRGESLRARLQQGPLPVAEGLAILRDVAMALDYAHARGVVHRDIKPENVLLSGRTAVVTDFGIAKALKASKTDAPAGVGGATTLTAEGSWLGTPAYMAPERAAGDPSADQRADLYAWGVIAYEVLGGRHPFADRTSPQQLLAAHMGEEPRALDGEAVDCARRTADALPPGIVALVMQCLAKDPAERPASAAAVLASLDVARDSALREAGVPRSRTLVRIFSLYSASIIGVAVMARIATDAIGLPDWVLPGALIVMALGLPVLLITGFALRRPQLGAGQASRTRPEILVRRIQPYLTWRRATIGGAAALGIFALVVAGYMVLRALGIGPAGSLFGAGVLADREPLIVADFRVAGPDTALGPVVAEAIRTNLGQSRAISIVALSRVSDALTRMERPAGMRLDAALAREVAQREGVRAVVGGDLTPLGGGYLVTLRLLSSENGDELASFRRMAEAPQDLIPTLDGLSRDLRGKIGESLKAVRADPPLEQVTTSSLDALRKYTVAFRASVAGEHAKALALAREAVAIDSSFAMAWRTIGASLGSMRILSAEQDSAVERAYRYRARLTTREALLATSSYFSRPPHRDLRKMAQIQETLLARDSTDFLALTNLGAFLNNHREFARAEALFRRSVEALPNYTPYYNLSLAQNAQGKLAASESTAAFIMRRFPTADNAPLAGIHAAYARFDFDSVEARAARWHAEGATLAARGRAMTLLFRVARLRGRLAEARKLTGETSTLEAAAGVPNLALEDSLDAARDDLWLRRQPVRSMARLDVVLASPTLSGSAPAARRATLLAVAALQAAGGQADRARAVLAQAIAGADTGERLTNLPARLNAEAEIALAEGRGEEAFLTFARSDWAADGLPATPCVACVLPGIARALERSGMIDSARVIWERYVITPRVTVEPTDQWFLAIAYRRLGELYGDAGNNAKAAEYDRRFIALWEHADPELQPQVDGVRRHLALIEQETAPPLR